jgi:hypothetical protein
MANIYLSQVGRGQYLPQSGYRRGQYLPQSGRTWPIFTSVRVDLDNIYLSQGRHGQYLRQSG